MSDVFRITWENRVICLTRARWDRLTTSHHPEFASTLDWVRDAVEHPDFVNADRDDDQMLYHYQERGKFAFVRVSVMYRRRGVLRSLTGFVTDTIVTTRETKREVRLWPKPS